jgi:hypothetical protein
MVSGADSSIPLNVIVTIDKKNILKIYENTKNTQKIF